MTKDPLGQAILDFAKNGKASDVIVHSDLCEDDIIPTSYLFRSFQEMPKLEQVALKACKGSVLDIGIGAGIHASYLKNNHIVKGIDTSSGAISHVKSQGIDCEEIDILSYSGETYDTLLLLMNGLGLAGSLDKLPTFLNHLKTLLNNGGQIICDSTDVMYMYEDEDGGMWMDLNAEYYGNFKFQMEYENTKGDWFDWLYIDLTKLREIASSVGLSTEVLVEDTNTDHYLVRLTVK